MQIGNARHGAHDARDRMRPPASSPPTATDIERAHTVIDTYETAVAAGHGALDA